MKKLVSIVMLLAMQASLTFACDFCNCYLGLNPHYKKNSLGLRYHLMHYKGTHMMDESELQQANLSKSDFWELRNTIELYGQWYSVQKLQVVFSLPYIVNSEGMSREASAAMENMHHHSHGANQNQAGETIYGFGDPLIIAHYQLFNKTAGDSAGFSHRLMAGGGIKFPLGKYKLEDGEDPMKRMMMPGTGSWDFLASAVYLGKIKRVGINVNLSYLFTTVNKQDYQFGFRFNGNATAYYQVNVKKTMLYPSIGVFVEQASKDLSDGYTVYNTGGTILFAHAGLDFYYKNFSISGVLQIPAFKSLNQPQPEMNCRFITGISYAFNKMKNKS